MGQRRVKLNAMRKFIGNALRESVITHPCARSYAQVDTTELLQFKDELRAAGKSVTFGALIAKAIAVALEDSPDLNSYLDGDEIVISDEVNVGVAMQGPRGLYVPVVRNVQDKNVEEITADMRELSRKVKNNEIIPDDLAGGTITLSSDGTGRTEVFGSILTGNQCLLIGTGRTKKQPVVLEDGTIGVRDMTWVAFNMNHTITDGIFVSRFTDRLCEVMEAPHKYLAL